MAALSKLGQIVNARALFASNCGVKQRKFPRFETIA
jgi:hypothetical protein